MNYNKFEIKEYSSFQILSDSKPLFTLIGLLNKSEIILQMHYVTVSLIKKTLNTRHSFIVCSHIKMIEVAKNIEDSCDFVKTDNKRVFYYCRF